MFAAHAEAYSLGMVAVRGDSKSREEGLARSIDLAKSTQIDAGCDESELMFAGVWRPGEHICVYGAVSKEDVLLERGTLLFAVLDDSDVDDVKFQPAWNGCLDLFNLMQFFWGFAFVSKSALSDAVFGGSMQRRRSRSMVPMIIPWLPPVHGMRSWTICLDRLAPLASS